MSIMTDGACSFLVCNGELSLVMPKARVAPVKPLTVPRMEVTAVLLAASLIIFIQKAYEYEMRFDSISAFILELGYVTKHSTDGQFRVAQLRTVVMVP